MAKNRYINTKFWDDDYTGELDPIEKLLFLYCLTNPLTNISGIYEIRLKRISFDTGIDKDMVLKIFDRFEIAQKIKYHDGWVAIKNFIKHQSVNPKITKGIDTELKKAPFNLIDWINDEKAPNIEQKKPIDSLSKPLNYSNINLNTNINTNINTNSNINTKKENSKSTAKPEKKLFLDCVKLTDSEYKKLLDAFALEETLEKIERLNNYVMSTGKKYKSHYHTILNWSKKDSPKKHEEIKYKEPDLNNPFGL